MKTVPTLKLAMGILLSALVFTGCKKGDTGPAGPTGPQGPQGPVITFINSGFISGTITGTRKDDGVAFNEPFSYNYNTQGNGDQVDSIGSNMFTFTIDRYTNDIFANKSAYINITTTSKTASTGTLSFNLNYERQLTSSKLFSFNCNTYSATATSLNYNQSSGLFTGNFSITLSGTQNSTGNTATVTGSFQATMIQVVNLKHQESGIKMD